DALRTPVLRQLRYQRVDVAELNRAAARLVRRALTRAAVVRMVRVRVELLQPVPLQRPHERHRIHRRTTRARRVVAARTRDAARDLLVRETGLVHAGVDRVADLHVVLRTDENPGTGDALVLRRKPDRVV